MINNDYKSRSVVLFILQGSDRNLPGYYATREEAERTDYGDVRVASVSTRVLSRTQAAYALGVSTTSLDRYRRKGLIPSLKDTNNSLMFSVECLERFLETVLGARLVSTGHNLL